MNDGDMVESAEDTVLRTLMIEQFVLTQKFRDRVSSYKDQGYSESDAEDIVIYEFELQEGIF